MTATASSSDTIVICIPVFNDWPSVRVLLQRLDAVAPSLSARVDVLLVEDGSDELDPTILEQRAEHLHDVSILRLRRNLGHQRAIAIGLTYLYVTENHDFVVVMDGDGEDRPEDLSSLIGRCDALGRTRVVFAGRAKRSERLAFRIGYRTYQFIHKLLVGRHVEVGNFSVVPRTALARLVAVAEMWNHYAASVYHARIPLDVVPIARGHRIAGQSTMNFVALVVHGLSAVSVYHDVVGVRMIMLIFTLILFALFGVATIVGVRLYTDLAIPGWATTAGGVMLVSLLNLIVLGAVFTLFTLRSRSEYSFLPLRDYKHFVLELRRCKTQASP